MIFVIGKKVFVVQKPILYVRVALFQLSKQTDRLLPYNGVTLYEVYSFIELMMNTNHK